jgi:SAM-dependent methyltransferase
VWRTFDHVGPAEWSAWAGLALLAVARSMAAAEGLGNVEFRQGDAQIYPFERDRFDVVMSRMGSMFFGDPVAAFTNLHGALRPGGRLTLLTWQSLDANEWITELRAAMAVGRVLPKPPPEAPSPFALADPVRPPATRPSSHYGRRSPLTRRTRGDVPIRHLDRRGPQTLRRSPVASRSTRPPS